MIPVRKFGGAWLAIGLLWLSLARLAFAAPTLHVRGRAQLALEALRRTPTGVTLVVRLTDATDGEPLVRTVAIAVDGPSGYFHYAEPTDNNGRVEFHAALGGGQFQLRLRAEGDSDHAAPEPIVRMLDLSRRQPCLAVDAPASIEDGRAAFTLKLDVTDCELVTGGGVAPPVEDGEVRAIVDNVEVGRGRTFRGHAEIEIARAALGESGRRVSIETQFLGNSLLAGTVERRGIDVLAASRFLDLRLASRGNLVHLSGTLDVGHAQLGSGVIHLRSAAETGDAPSDLLIFPVAGNGRFVAPPLMLPSGDHALVAVFTPHSQLVAGARSEAMPVHIVPPVPWRWGLPPVVALVLFALRWMFTRITARAPQSSRVGRSLRPMTATRSVQLLVRDAITLQPIGGAIITSAAGTIATDEQGCVAIAPTGVLSIAAAGYGPRRIELTTKLAGHLVIDLLSHRERAYALLLAVARAQSRGRPVDERRMTPRDILAMLDTKQLLLGPVTTLGDTIERIYFGPTTAPESSPTLDEAARLAVEELWEAHRSLLGASAPAPAPSAPVARSDDPLA